MDTLLQDLRFAIRSLRRAPTFAASAVATLALGIGAVTTIYSVVHAVLLRPLPYERPGDLAIVWGTVRRDSVERRSVSYPDFEDWRRDARAFDAVAAFTESMFTLDGREGAERIEGEWVSASYFGALGVRPVLGRIFTPAEDAVGAGGAVAILSHELWRSRFGASSAAVGSALNLNGQPTTVVGVMPPGFRGLGDDAQLWVPFANPPGGTGTPSILEDRGSRWHQVVARLRPGATLAGAQAELDAISRRLAAQYPESNDRRGAEVVALEEELVGGLRRGLLVLLGAVGLVLLVACANTANLLLVRAAARERELAIRAALGASRARTARQLLVESLVLAVVGGTAGALLSVWAVAILARLNPVDLPSFVRLEVSGAALAGTSIVVLVVAAAFGVVAIAFASEGRLAESLKAGARSVGAGRRAGRLRAALVAGELALAVVLLAGAGLMLRTLESLRRFDPGFRAEQLVSFRLDLSQGQYDAARAVAFGTALREQVRGLPAVRAVSLSDDVPLDGRSSGTIIRIAGKEVVTQGSGIRVYRHRVAPGYFAAIGATVVRGREFTTADDRGRGRVAVISERMARRFWPNEDPVGARLQLNDTTFAEIVGVVADMKHRALLEAATADPDVYYPILQVPTTAFSLVVRAGGDPAALVAAVRREVSAADRGVPVYDVATMRDRVRGETAPARFQASLLGAFAALALLLAAVGVYGVMAYSVAQRTREVGIRMALGADRRDIVRMIVGTGARLTGLGLVLGVVAAVATVRVMAGLLYGVEPTDPATLATAVGVLAAAALLASWLPARRAARVEPVTAMRES
ncbi:MAG TPA: ABC transporter permease [Gemmatimonadaceae bacterium]|nr:ABC transporter permease [Gemmatimonadaceae bacterium]